MLRAVQPETTLAEFTRGIPNGIADCLNVPYQRVAGNYSGCKDAHRRLDHHTYFKAIRVDPLHREYIALDRILAS